jgi:hypothetical protein
MFWKVRDVASIGRPLDVQMQVLAASLSDPRTPTGREIDYVLAVLKGDWNLKLEAFPLSLIWKGQFVNNVAAPTKTVALLPPPDFTTVMIRTLITGVACAEP